jgi:hypothetical protein
MRLALPALVMFNVDAALHLIIAGLGLYCLLRDWQVRPVGAAFGALIFCLSGPFIPRVLAGHASVLHSIAWTGWLLLVYRRLLHRPSWIYLLWMVVFVALTLLGGHPQMSAIALMVPAFYFLAYVVAQVRKQTWRELGLSLIVSVAVVVFAVGLTAVQFVPFVDFLAETSRGAGEAKVVERMTDHSFLPHDLVRLFLPHIYTDVEGATVIGTTGQGNYWEKSAFVGIIPYVVIGLAVWRRLFRRESRLLFLGLIALAGLALSLGTINPVYDLAAKYAPYFRAPGRFLLLWAFGIAALAGIALDRLPPVEQHHPGYRRQWNKLSEWVAALAVLAASLFLIWHFFWQQILSGWRSGVTAPETFATVVDTVTQTAVPFIATLLLIVVLLRLGARTGADLRHWRFLALLALFAELVLYSRFSIHAHPLDDLRDPDHPLALLDPDPAQVRLDGERTPPMYLVPTLDHVTNGEERLALETLLALPIERGQRLLAAGYEATSEPLDDLGMDLVFQANGAYLYRRQGTLPRLYAASSVRVVESDDEALLQFRVFSFRPEWLAVVTSPAGETSTELAELSERPPGPLDFEGAITRYDNNTVHARVSVDRPALIVFTEMYDPGWAATVDGEPVQVWKANYALRGVVVGPGEHTVEMRYSSAPFRLGLAITLVTAAALGLSVLLRLAVSRRLAQR